MSTIVHLQLPNSVHQKLLEYSQQDGISMDQFVATAIAEKLASLATVNYLEQRAARGSKEKYHAVLAKVPRVEPDEDDKLEGS